MKKQILLALMMTCATCAMAVSFPSNGVGGGSTGEGYEPVGGVGPSYNNSSILGNAGASCAQQTWITDQNGCAQCCLETVTLPCLTEASGNPTAAAQCETLGAQCINDCAAYLGKSPLDSSVYFLLTLIAAYGAVAVYRKKAGTKVA